MGRGITLLFVALLFNLCVWAVFLLILIRMRSFSASLGCFHAFFSHSQSSASYCFLKFLSFCSHWSSSFLSFSCSRLASVKRIPSLFYFGYWFCPIQSLSCKSAYLFLLSENVVTPHCLEKFLSLFNTPCWSVTCRQVSFFCLDRSVIESCSRGPLHG